MKLEKQELAEKRLRRAAARIDEIHRELSSRTPIPLPRKIFVGHWRYIAVRADVLRSSVGSQVQMVVEKCNHWVLGKKGEPSSYRSSTEVVLSSRETGFAPGQGLRPLGRDAWESAAFPDFFEKKWFRRIPRLVRAGTKNIEVDRYFPQVPPHMLEFAYKPAFISEASDLDGDLESELRRLYAMMRLSHGWERISGRHADEWDMSLDRRRFRERESRAEARRWLSEDREC